MQAEGKQEEEMCESQRGKKESGKDADLWIKQAHVLSHKMMQHWVSATFKYVTLCMLVAYRQKGERGYFTGLCVIHSVVCGRKWFMLNFKSSKLEIANLYLNGHDICVIHRMESVKNCPCLLKLEFQTTSSMLDVFGLHTLYLLLAK